MSKILVAEDNPLNLELIREILEASGHEVIEACDGQQALDKLAASVPDLVLLDIQMPVLDGYAVLRELRQTPRFASLRVLARPRVRCCSSPVARNEGHMVPASNLRQWTLLLHISTAGAKPPHADQSSAVSMGCAW